MFLREITANQFQFVLNPPIALIIHFLFKLTMCVGIILL